MDGIKWSEILVLHSAYYYVLRMVLVHVNTYGCYKQFKMSNHTCTHMAIWLSTCYTMCIIESNPGYYH